MPKVTSLPHIAVGGRVVTKHKQASPSVHAPDALNVRRHRCDVDHDRKPFESPTQKMNVIGDAPCDFMPR